MIKWLKNIGPGPLVAAAFIGPGTVAVCTLAGVGFGLDLLWALLFSILATVVLQEMSARLGLISQKSLSETLRNNIKSPVARNVMILLVLLAVVGGNAAYEAGNISGGVLGMEVLVGHNTFDVFGLQLNVLSLILGGLAALLLFFGNYKVLEKVLLTMVVLMSLAFLLTAIKTKPSLMAILKGVVQFKSPEGSLMAIIGLIGTTVVPYNLFLHSSLVKEKWKAASDLKYARRDTIVAIILGGVVSMCVVVSASAIQTQEVSGASDLALGLEPLFGENAKYFLSLGLFAAGLTSAITAPLAAAFVACGCLGWCVTMKSKRFRMVWMTVLAVGVLFSSVGFKPIEIIKFAQFFNGLLLPVIAGILIWLASQSSILGQYKNSRFQNITGILILLITVFLGLKSILSVVNVI